MPDRGRGDLALLVRQARYQTTVFLRTPRALFFTLFFPLFFMFLFNSLSSGQRVATRGNISFAQFFTPGIAVFALVSACYTGLAMSVVIARESLLLKRVRGTPLPVWMYLAGRIASMVLISLSAVAVMFTAGVFAYHVKINWHSFPATVVTLFVGAATFCALGLAVTAIVSTAEGAPAVINFTMFPVLFISDVFFQVDTAPTWLQTIGWLFPIKHCARLLQDQFSPFGTGSGFEWTHLAVMGAWLIGAVLVATRRFRWEPRASEGRLRARNKVVSRA